MKTSTSPKRKAGPVRLAAEHARDFDLEEQIAKSGEAPAKYLEYAEWLRARGEPLGDLLPLVKDLAAHPTDKKLLAQEAKLLAALDARIQDESDEMFVLRLLRDARVAFAPKRGTHRLRYRAEHNAWYSASEKTVFKDLADYHREYVLPQRELAALLARAAKSGARLDKDLRVHGAWWRYAYVEFGPGPFREGYPPTRVLWWFNVDLTAPARLAAAAEDWQAAEKICKPFRELRPRMPELFLPKGRALKPARREWTGTDQLEQDE